MCYSQLSTVTYLYRERKKEVDNKRSLSFVNCILIAIAIKHYTFVSIIMMVIILSFACKVS